MRPEDHAQLFAGPEPPPLLHHEDLYVPPIRVDLDRTFQESSKLNPTLRINLGETHTVEQDREVLSVGKIPREHMDWLKHCWRRIIDTEV